MKAIDLQCHRLGNHPQIAAHEFASINIEDLGLLYKVDVLDYYKYKDTPIGEHIARVAKPFYENI